MVLLMAVLQPWVLWISARTVPYICVTFDCCDFPLSVVFCISFGAYVVAIGYSFGCVCTLFVVSVPKLYNVHDRC
jgi:hypothetical protein